MKNLRAFLSFIAIFVFCQLALPAQTPTPTATATPAPNPLREYITANYTKREVMIPMRDGVKLFTSIYEPKDKSEKYPILLNRTPYTVAPYGADKIQERARTEPSCSRKEGYIFVYQDVRGRWMCEGEFEDVRPDIDNNTPKDIDESTDTYDTIEWLIKNVENNNGRVGIYGISYPGFYTSAGSIDSHPALKACSPQAPVGDWFHGDDMHHNGALFLAQNYAFFRIFRTAAPDAELRRMIISNSGKVDRRTTATIIFWKIGRTQGNRRHLRKKPGHAHQVLGRDDGASELRPVLERPQHSAETQKHQMRDDDRRRLV